VAPQLKPNVRPIGHKDMTIRTHLLDASALVKLSVKEDKSDMVLNYFNNHTVFSTTSFCLAESLGALKMKRARGEITDAEYQSAGEELAGLVRNGSISIEDVRFTDRDVFDEVLSLCSKYLGKDKGDFVDMFQIVTLKRGFRTLLAGDSKTILITADCSLAEVARNEGVRVWDCMKEPAP
jgi:hypothetical protein